MQQQYYNQQQPIRNTAIPPQTTLYPPQHVNTNHISYVAATVMQPIYSPQGYQIPVAYAFSGHGDQYTAHFPNKLNQNAVPAHKNIVTVNNYIPQGSVAVQVPQPVILQKSPQNSVTMHPVIIPQTYVTVATPVHPVSLNQTNVVNVNPVQVNPQNIVSATTTVTTVTANDAKASLLPSQSAESVPDEKAQTNKTPLHKQNGAENNAAPQNKSWASLFNKNKNKEDKKTEEVVVNGCTKTEQLSVTTEECDHEFAAIKKQLREKYDDPTFFRVGGNL